MFLRKKAKPVYEMRLEKYFDNHAAEIAYRLVKYEIKNGELQDGFYWMAGGDGEWARKISKHYGLKPTDPIFGDD